MYKNKNIMNKTIGIMKTLNDSLEKAYWQYKNLVRPLLDNVDIIYDKPCNESFKEKLEAVQDNACLAITGAIRGTSRERLYWELGLLEIFPYISAKKIMLLLCTTLPDQIWTNENLRTGQGLRFSRIIFLCIASSYGWN